MSRGSSNTRKNALEILEKLGYCVGCTKHQPNSRFCLNCGKPIMPKLKRRKGKGYRIVCPYCGKDYSSNYYEKHIKNVHSGAILRHFRKN